MTTLIKELIDIPDSIQTGDFVLRLAEDINRPEVVLGNYVVLFTQSGRCSSDKVNFALRV